MATQKIIVNADMTNIVHIELDATRHDLASELAVQLMAETKRILKRERPDVSLLSVKVVCLDGEVHLGCMGTPYEHHEEDWL